MKAIQVRNVPDKTHKVLRRRAAEAGMSLQEYLLATLNDVAGQPTVEEVLARAGERAGGKVGLRTAVGQLRVDRGRR